MDFLNDYQLLIPAASEHSTTNYWTFGFIRNVRDLLIAGLTLNPLLLPYIVTNSAPQSDISIEIIEETQEYMIHDIQSPTSKWLSSRNVWQVEQNRHTFSRCG